MNCHASTCQLWQGSVNFGANRTASRPSSAKFVQMSPRPGQILPKSSQTRSMSPQIGSKWAELGPSSAQCGSIPTVFGQGWPETGRTRQQRPESIKRGSISAKIVRGAVKFGTSWVNSGSISARFVTPREAERSSSWNYQGRVLCCHVGRFGFEFACLSELGVSCKVGRGLVKSDPAAPENVDDTHPAQFWSNRPNRVEIGRMWPGIGRHPAELGRLGDKVADLGRCLKFGPNLTGLGPMFAHDSCNIGRCRPDLARSGQKSPCLPNEVAQPPFRNATREQPRV